MENCFAGSINVFFFTFLGYTMNHALRTTWSYSKNQLQSQPFGIGITNQWLGFVDLSFMLGYAFGLTFIGPQGDHNNKRRFLTLGYVIAAGGYLLFPLAHHVSDTHNHWLLIVGMAIAGIGSGFGLPGSVAALSKWFTGNQKGTSMGFWSGCQNLGNVLGFVISTIIAQSLHLQWNYNFFIMASLSLLVALLIFLFLDDSKDQTSEEILATEHIQNQYNIISCFTISKVTNYVISFCCIKGIIYGLLFWLPKYIQEMGMNLHSGLITSMIDIGGFIGGLILGYLSDQWKNRSIFLVPFLSISGLMMAVTFSFLGKQVVPYYPVMLAMGFGIGGAYNIIGTMMPIDLADQPEVRGNKKIVSLITATIDGCGALFSSMTMLLLAHVTANWIFKIMLIYLLVAVAALLPIVLKDLNKQKEVV